MLSYAGLLVPVALVDGAGNAQGRQVVDVLNVDGTTATVYADAARTALTGAVASDATGNVSGVYAEPGVYRLRFSVLGVSYEVQTVASIDPREITDLHTLVTGNSGSVSAEATARTAADSAESSARAAADSAEAALRASGDTNETNTRAAADAAEAALRASLAATEAADAAAAATANGNEVTARAAAVLAEQNRALAAEAANAASIASNTSAVARLTLTTTATKTAAYTAAPGDLIPVSTAGGPVTVTLPAAPATGTLVAVKHTVQGGTNTVTIAASGTDHFNTSTGPTTATLTLLNQAVHLQYAGGVWLVVADDLPLSQLDGRFLTPSAAAGAYAPLDARDTSITSFAVGQIVVSGTTLYKVTTAHAAPFDTAKATSVGGGGAGGGVTATVNGATASSLAITDATLTDLTALGAWAAPTAAIPAWAATTSYPTVGQLVTNGGFVWSNKTAHTSGGSFSGTTNWVQIGPLAGVALGAASLDSGGQVPLAQLGNAPAGGGSLSVQDEGGALSTAATTLNFVGAGVTASGTGATKTITVPGGSGGGDGSVGQRWVTGDVGHSARPNALWSNATALVSSRLHLVDLVDVIPGTLSSLSFLAGTTAMVTATHQWFCLVDPTTLQVVAVTADDTSTAWAASTVKTLALSAPYTYTSGRLMAGIMVSATTVPSLAGFTQFTAAAAGGVTVARCGYSSTAQTTPLAVGTAVTTPNTTLAIVPACWAT